MGAELPEDLAAIEAEGRRLVERSSTLSELRAATTEVLGRRSAVAAANQALGSLPAERRPGRGKALGTVRRHLEEAIEGRRSVLEEQERRSRLDADRLDLGEVLPSGLPGRLHMVTQAEEELEDTFLGMGFEVVEGPEAETDWYNFEALNMPAAHPARSMWDTFYLRLGPPESTLLRTHTSPVQIRLMQSRPPPFYAVMPGACYRRDTPDATHLAAFHQIEGLVVDRSTSFADLAGTIEVFTGAYFGTGMHSRLRPAYFPFTEPSAEFEVTCAICGGDGCRTCSGSGWIELGGCGMVDPAVLQAVGIDPEAWSGFAFGFGIDRCAQMRHGVSDLRLLADNDVRLLSQL